MKFTPNQYRRNWRDALPHPADYCPYHVTKLSRAKGSGWAQGICPFHNDNDASFSAQLSDLRGGRKCFAGCGSGDFLALAGLIRVCASTWWNGIRSCRFPKPTRALGPNTTAWRVEDIRDHFERTGSKERD